MGVRVPRIWVFAWGIVIGAAIVLFVAGFFGAVHAHPRSLGAQSRQLMVGGDELIGGRPAGCPFQFCGCGLAKYLGINDRRLNLAWNWARLFPRTHAQPGAAAVRHHHVMLLERQVSPGRWVVLDFNGGRHLTWRHVRNVGGYIFVSVGGRNVVGSVTLSSKEKSSHSKLHHRSSQADTADSTGGRYYPRELGLSASS